MDANIGSIVQDIKKVSLEQVIFEAITNSMQANANNIKVYFDDKNNSFDTEDSQLISKVEIIDNGDGFTEENISSFKTYRSTHKKNLGSKGIGRFFYLKLFSQVNIKSLSKNIKFSIKNDVEISEKEERYNETTVELINPKDSFYIKKNKFKENLVNHFLPYFKLLKDDKKLINIDLFFNGVKFCSVDNLDIPNFKEATFNIHRHEFNLHYIINDKAISAYDGFYCASNRVVLKNSELKPKIKFKSFCGVNILFLLSSKYFDKNVNNERDDFNIKPIQVSEDLYTDLSWSDIHDSLSEKIRELCLGYGIDIAENAKKNLNESIRIAPFLAHYLDKNDSALSSEDLIKNAKKHYDEDKEFLRESKNSVESSYNLILNRVVQSELAEYIFDREKIINKLISIVDDKKIEQEIHNLFMQQRTEDNSMNYKSNNLWLFDDRFMTYDRVFSEAQIKDIFPELSNNFKRLDICIISNTDKKEEITDIVIIELKRPSDEITPARAEEQLLEYSRYVNTSRQENKVRIWAYAFLKFNESVEASLSDKDYNKIPTHNKYPIYYRYYDRTNVIVNFMDYKALADDAHTRNQTFINILKGRTYLKD